jgi:hypothetical protein
MATSPTTKNAMTVMLKAMMAARAPAKSSQAGFVTPLVKDVLPLFVEMESWLVTKSVTT